MPGRAIHQVVLANIRRWHQSAMGPGEWPLRRNLTSGCPALRPAIRPSTSASTPTSTTPATSSCACALSRMEGQRQWPRHSLRRKGSLSKTSPPRRWPDGRARSAGPGRARRRLDHHRRRDHGPLIILMSLGYLIVLFLVERMLTKRTEAEPGVEANLE